MFFFDLISNNELCKLLVSTVNDKFWSNMTGRFLTVLLEAKLIQSREIESLGI